jgi:S-adenosylmethionine synthetase
MTIILRSSRRETPHDLACSQVALANDTSIGVGYAPLSRLEQLVLSVEQHINASDRVQQHPAWGEDVKVMGLRITEKLF